MSAVSTAVIERMYQVLKLMPCSCARRRHTMEGVWLQHTLCPRCNVIQRYEAEAELVLQE